MPNSPCPTEFQISFISVGDLERGRQFCAYRRHEDMGCVVLLGKLCSSIPGIRARMIGTKVLTIWAGFHDKMHS